MQNRSSLWSEQGIRRCRSQIFLATLRNCGGLEAELLAEEGLWGALTIMLSHYPSGQCKFVMLAKHSQSSQTPGV